MKLYCDICNEEILGYPYGLNTFFVCEKCFEVLKVANAGSATHTIKNIIAIGNIYKNSKNLKNF